MVDRQTPILSQLRSEAAGLRGELAAMLAARWELARLELEATAAQTRRLAIVLACCGTVGAVGVMVLVALTVEVLHRHYTGRFLATAAGLAIAASLVAAYAAYRRFRREVVGLNESLAELREDARWLDEWFGGG
jgi:uncharacterized membrane protein YqjE